MNTCTHDRMRVVSTTAFAGPVAREENRAAHGNVCVREECISCGAQRRKNVNQCHVEEGAWGPSRAERVERIQSAIRLLEARLARSPAPAPIVRGDGLRAEIDADGCIVLNGEGCADAAASIPPDWLDAARRHRVAILALRAAKQRLGQVRP
jgi:hypothetical protein